MTRRYNRLHNTPRRIKQLKLYHIVQVLHADLPRRPVNNALVMRRRHHRSLEIRTLPVLVHNIYPVACVHARLELDTLAVHRDNPVTDNISARIDALAQEQIRKSETVNTDIQ